MRIISFDWALTTLAIFGSCHAFGADLEKLQREIATLEKRVTALEQETQRLKRECDVERLVVRKELIVSDTGQPWEKGFERQQIPRGLYARSLGDGPGGLWVRSRLIKAEIDDPFDDRFHALQCSRRRELRCGARRQRNRRPVAVGGSAKGVGRPRRELARDSRIFASHAPALRRMLGA